MNALRTAISSFNTAFKGRVNKHTQLFNALQGKRGYLYHVTNESTFPLEAAPLLNKNPLIVETDSEAQGQLGTEESFSTVFNTWTRISHLGDGAQPAIPSELDTWTFDEPTQQITCTVNSSSLVGFISPDRHDNYVFEVRLRSGQTTDDDSIGICLAYTEVNGQEHTIVAMRTPGGSQTHPNVGGDVGAHRARLLDVYADIFHPTDRLDLGSTNGGLMWGDGIVDDDRVTGDIGNTGGWNNYPTGCLIRVTRTGDDFVVETTDMGSDVYVPTARVEFSLNDDPALAKFKGPQRYGYVVYSQPNASWETQKKPAVLNQIIVLDSATSYRWDADNWDNTVSTSQLVDDLPVNRFFFNPNTRKLYYRETSGVIRRIRGVQ